MTYCFDVANIDWIREAKEIYPFNAFSMNPSIAARDLKGNNKSFAESVKEIWAEVGPNVDFHVQTVGVKADDIIKDAYAIMAMVDDPNHKVHVKVNCYPEGYKAMKVLVKEGFVVTATAIASVNQAMLAAECGAEVAAVYVGRTDNISGDGIDVIRRTKQIFRAQGITATRVSGASIKTAHMVEQAALAGADEVAIGYDVLKAISNHPLTSACIDSFTADWQGLYGEGKLIHNL
ncbi:MAG: hypothetical protein IJP03_06790 [Christensenellaceae bacterium]|nr:hypothetical protein [Christensenellaceae bacterium]